MEELFICQLILYSVSSTGNEPGHKCIATMQL